MGVVHICEERNKAVLQLDSTELQTAVSTLQSAVRSLPDRPAELARIWSLAAACKQKSAVSVVTPSAAALKQKLGVDLSEQADLGILKKEASSSMLLQPTPPPWCTPATPSSSLALASRGFGQSLEEAFAGLGRLKEENAGASFAAAGGYSDPSLPLPGAAASAYIKPEVGTASETKVSRTGIQNPEINLVKSASLSTGDGRLRRLSVEMSPWKGCFTTAASEHSKSRISSIVYCPALEAFAGDWEQKGWLISASSKLLNLWVCNRKPAGQPLELMHSQSTAAEIDAMDVDLGAKLLISVGSAAQARDYCVTLHSLSRGTFFKYQGKIQIPNRLSPEIRKQVHAGASNLIHVSSLQQFSGPLKSAIAVALGGEVLVYELAAASTVDAAVAPKAIWKAHDTAAISCLHRSSFGCNLITGACDGSIKVWDLRSRPSEPVRQFGHQKQVTGLVMLDGKTLSSCGADCSIQFWDFRSGNRAFSNIIPDGKPVLNMASACSSPNLISFTTRQSLYCLEFCGPDGLTTMLSPLRPLPPSGPCSDVKWNTLSKQIYAAGLDGAISVFGSAAFSRNVTSFDLDCQRGAKGNSI